MAISYKIKKIKSNRMAGDKNCYAVTLLTAANFSTEKVAEKMSLMSSFTPGETEGMIKNLASIIAEMLSDGYTITLDGLGTFSLSGGLSRDVSDPEEINSNDIEIKRICFKPCPKFRKKLGEVSFTRLPSNLERLRK